VRKIYHGKIAIEFNPFGPDLQLYSKGDYLHFVIADFWPYPLGTTKEPVVDNMYRKLNSGLDNLYQQTMAKWGKKVIIGSLAASSYDGTVINQPDWESQLYYYPNDTTVHIDVQEQADAYEAMLHAICMRDWIAGAYSFNYNYWNSYDKAPSVRNKPAEKVMAKWWRWLHPEVVHLSISYNEGGVTVPSQAAYVLKKDSIIKIRALASSGYTFSGWEGDVDSSNRKSNPLTLTMDQDKSIRAVFKNTTGVQNVNFRQKEAVQIYPNPAKTSINISYNLPHTASVTIKILSADGKLVKVLDRGVRTKGQHLLKWQIPSSQALASGVYHLVIRANEREWAKKVLIVK